MNYQIIQGDALTILQTMSECSFDACLCDPPYGLEFMGKEWDHGVPGAETWREVLRVLKPGAILMAFGGTRTWHRLACAIEDAGFELRDTMMYLYGSGFPKSMNLGKAMDKAARGVPQGGSDPTSPNHGRFKGGCSEDNKRGQGFGAGPGQFMEEAGVYGQVPVTDPEALRWTGYGTALKPAWEPILLAMKPCEGTFAENALKWGVAGLGIDAGRIECDSRPKREVHALRDDVEYHPTSLCGRVDGTLASSKAVGETSLGRWPANLLLDEEAAAMLDVANSNHPSCNSPSKAKPKSKFRPGQGNYQPQGPIYPGENGGPSRFFYTAKASRKERGEGNNHPTVKPLALCEYLARLVLPPAHETPRRLLVPFSGSGSEMIAAKNAGWDEVVGIELNPDYIAISESRIAQTRTDKYMPLFRESLLPSWFPNEEDGE